MPLYTNYNWVRNSNLFLFSCRYYNCILLFIKIEDKSCISNLIIPLPTFVWNYTRESSSYYISKFSAWSGHFSLWNYVAFTSILLTVATCVYIPTCLPPPQKKKEKKRSQQPKSPKNPKTENSPPLHCHTNKQTRTWNLRRFSPTKINLAYAVSAFSPAALPSGRGWTWACPAPPGAASGRRTWRRSTRTRPSARSRRWSAPVRRPPASPPAPGPAAAAPPPPQRPPPPAATSPPAS